MARKRALTIVGGDDDDTDPTSATYNPLRAAHCWFNERLFNGRLPRCMLSLRNHGKAFGYFASERFGTAAGDVTDEIAMNPRFVLSRPLPDVLSTLVHEMTHEAQAHFGKPSRNGYHNREWGRIMKSVGLHPSNTGLPGGRETGQQMSHYIMAGGPFEAACDALIATGFALRYGDVWQSKERKPDSAVKLTCPTCGIVAKAKPDVHLTCTDCDTAMVCPGGATVADLRAAA